MAIRQSPDQDRRRHFPTEDRRGQDGAMTSRPRDLTAVEWALAALAVAVVLASIYLAMLVR